MRSHTPPVIIFYFTSRYTQVHLHSPRTLAMPSVLVKFKGGGNTTEPWWQAVNLPASFVLTSRRLFDCMTPALEDHHPQVPSARSPYFRWQVLSMKVFWQGTTTEAHPVETHLSAVSSDVVSSVLNLMAQRGWKDFILVEYEENR